LATDLVRKWSAGVEPPVFPPFLFAFKLVAVDEIDQLPDESEWQPACEGASLGPLTADEDKELSVVMSFTVVRVVEAQIRVDRLGVARGVKPCAGSSSGG
jgi:hypothetical protein